jgi:hypothetical protein
LPFYRVEGGAGRPDGEGDQAASMSVVRFGEEGKRRGEWGVKRGEMRHHFRERRGHRGGGSARGRWWRRCPVGLLEEEDGRPADRVGPPISEGEEAGQAGPKGGGSEVGRDWAERGRERGGPRLGQKPEMAG